MPKLKKTFKDLLIEVKERYPIIRPDAPHKNKGKLRFPKVLKTKKVLLKL